MAKLTSEARDNLSDKAFALPGERRFPIQDLNHARNALARASGKPEEGKVRSAVYKKYPQLKEHHEEHDTKHADCAECHMDTTGEMYSGRSDSMGVSMEGAKVKKIKARGSKEQLDEPDEDELDEGEDEEDQYKQLEDPLNKPVDAKTLKSDSKKKTEDEEDEDEEDEGEEGSDEEDEDEEKNDSALSAPILHIDAPMTVGKNAEVMENGWLRAEALLTRTGIFEYKNDDGSIRRELRLPEEVFKKDSLATMSMLPLTANGYNGHPPEPLNGENTKMYQVGQLGEDINVEGEFVKSKILVTDSKVVKEILSGERNQLSVGYFAQTEDKPGTWKGQRYDSIQRNIKANHVALTGKARGGPDLKVRLDSGEPVMVSVEYLDTGANTVPNKFNIDGVDYEVAEPMVAALQKLTARADSAEAEVKRLSALNTPETIQARVTARVSLEKRATEILGNSFKMDGLADLDIKLAVIEKLDGDKPKNTDPVYVEARYDGALAHASAFANRGGYVKASQIKTDADVPSAAAARQRMIANQESMFLNAPKEK